MHLFYPQIQQRRSVLVEVRSEMGGNRRKEHLQPVARSLSLLSELIHPFTPHSLSTFDSNNA
ncbi:MAG: hypothetical protein K6T90_19210 [Leptolyngbyaceae cyanobacterium HOT.MB2.61]|nr:hypothetical protein [Leptolyngbyaceae cyanobacterium HOT.MB2.61]